MTDDFDRGSMAALLTLKDLLLKSGQTDVTVGEVVELIDMCIAEIEEPGTAAAELRGDG